MPGSRYRPKWLSTSRLPAITGCDDARQMPLMNPEMSLRVRLLRSEPSRHTPITATLSVGLKSVLPRMAESGAALVTIANGPPDTTRVLSMIA